MIIAVGSPHSLEVGETTAASPNFREVFDGQARFVWRSLLGLGVRETDVPDASQQVFLVVHAKLARLEPGCAVRTFVYGICLRVASDFRRRAHVRRELLCAEPPERKTLATPEDHASHREALVALQGALDELDEGQRDVFVLYELEDVPMAEVAQAVGCPLQTAYSRLHVARKLIAAAFAHRDDQHVSAVGRQR
jgi:RNA polymerase sigma-70 factor (ECF subfamily)